MTTTEIFNSNQLQRNPETWFTLLEGVKENRYSSKNYIYSVQSKNAFNLFGQNYYAGSYLMNALPEQIESARSSSCKITKLSSFKLINITELCAKNIGPFDSRSARFQNNAEHARSYMEDMSAKIKEKYFSNDWLGTIAKCFSFVYTLFMKYDNFDNFDSSIKIPGHTGEYAEQMMRLLDNKLKVWQAFKKNYDDIQVEGQQGDNDEEFEKRWQEHLKKSIMETQIDYSPALKE